MPGKPNEQKVGTIKVICADGTLAHNPGVENDIAIWHNDEGTHFGTVGKEVDKHLDFYYELTGYCVKDHPKRVVKIEIDLHTLTHYNHYDEE